MEHLDGRTDTAQALEKNSSLTTRMLSYLRLIEQRWPCEMILALPMIDGARVREIAFQLRLINHWSEETEELWKTQQITMVKKKRMASSRCAGFRPIAMLPTIYRLSSKTLQQLAGQTLLGHVPGRHAHEVV